MEYPAGSTATASEDKTVAIVSYLTLLGFFIAVVLQSQKKTALGAFHLRQTLGFIVTWFAVGLVFIVPILGWIIGLVAFPFIFVLYVLGFIGALQGKAKPVPLIGGMYQRWFAGSFD